MRHLISLTLGLLLVQGCVNPAPETYTEADFESVRKFDAHVHANVDSPVFMEVAQQSNFEILSINVDYPDFPIIDRQADVAEALHDRDDTTFHYATTFRMDDFGTDAWEEDMTARISRAVDDGAVGVKVWKNVGMVEDDADGNRIFLNDQRFDALAAQLKLQGVPLIAHQGEPRNCWLPLDEMTTNNDRLYFSSHPEYYMFLHPEEPRYEELMGVRDEFVAKHPDLDVVGAHLASLEWSVDRIGAFLDAYPNATVDMAARMSELQNQSNQDREKVREFFVKYQDRILYGSDLTHNPMSMELREQNPPVADDFAAQADTVWRADWRYLATEESQFVGALQVDTMGLNLPRKVIDKIYYDNAVRVFGLPDRS